MMRAVPTKTAWLPRTSKRCPDIAASAHAIWLAGLGAFAAAERVLDALGESDQVALAGFDSRYWGIAAFTRDRDAIRKRIVELLPDHEAHVG